MGYKIMLYKESIPQAVTIADILNKDFCKYGISVILDGNSLTFNYDTKSDSVRAERNPRGAGRKRHFSNRTIAEVYKYLCLDTHTMQETAEYAGVSICTLRRRIDYWQERKQWRADQDQIQF